MALKIEELQVLISANADQFKGELLKINESLGRMSSNTNGISKSIGGNLFPQLVGANVVGTLITSTFGKVVSTFKSATSEVIANGSALARLRIANSAVAGNLGITSEAMQKLRDDLADANTYGIAAEQIISSLALSGLTKLADKLSYVDGRTGETKEGVTALTLAIKDLAAARGLDSTAGIERVSGFIQTGRTELVDGLIEIGEITRKYQTYALSIGKASGDQLSELERAQVRLNITMEEGAKSFGAYAATYNSSGKIFSSVKQLIRGIAAEIGSNLEPVLRVGSLVFLEFFRGIQETAFGGANSIRDFSNKVAGYLVAVVRIIGSLLQNLPLVGNGFKRLANLTISPIKATGQLSQGITGTGNAMDGTAKKADKLKKALAGLAGFDEMNVLTEPSDSSGGGAGDAGAGAEGGALGGLGGAGDFADTTKEINEYADQATNAFKKLGDKIRDFLKPLREFKIFGKPIIDILGEIAKWLGILNIGFFLGSKAFGLIATTIGTLLSVLSPVVTIFGALSGVFAAIGAPMFILIGTIAAVAAGFVYLMATSEGFRNKVEEILNTIFTWFQKNILPIFVEVGKVVTQMVGVFVSRIPDILKALNPLIDSVGKFLSGAFKLLGDTVIWIWNNALAPLVSFILANIVPAFDTAINIVISSMNIFKAFFDVISGIVIPVLRVLFDTFRLAFMGIRDVVEFVWSKTVEPIFRGLYNFVRGTIIPVIEGLYNTFKSVFEAVGGIVSRVWNGIRSSIDSVLIWIYNNVFPMINKVKEAFEGAFGKVSEIAKSIWAGVLQGIKDGINGVIDLLNKAFGTINRLIKAANKVPGVNIDEIGSIPRLAKGGITNGPIFAEIGEAGREAVLPLENNTEWMDVLAAKLTTSGGGNGAGVTIPIYLGGEKIFEEFVEWHNNKSMANNSMILNA